ncbi:hypothetical protein JKP88DRAFT_253471 [Tribonema minus]|uniref:C2 domain-containing protein n=1 Tax=Tribonema minus TaxID=303371 RepID=A0A835ZA41_9STRA|nr:hypothetical protein JKP88DRAFT_253471 [Tribonema minus]
MPDVEYLRLVLWASTKAATGMTTTKRTPLGEVSLTLGELQPLKLKGLNPYTRRLHSEKFPGAEVLIWSTPDANLHAISLAPGGMASVAPAKFNPMIERFTFIKIDLLTGLPMTPPLTALPTPPPEDPLLSAVALPPAPAAALAPTPSQPPASPWQYQSQPATQAPPSIVTVQEMTVEPKFSVSLPLELLRPLYSMLKVASQAWQGRVEMERIRQGYFSSNAEAFAEGRVLVKVNISEAAALDGIALYSAGAASMGSVTTAAMAAAAATSTSPTGTQPSTPVPEMSPEFGGGNALSPPAGGSAGGAGAQGGFKLSNMKRLGGKAMALAKNAAQVKFVQCLCVSGVYLSPLSENYCSKTYIHGMAQQPRFELNTYTSPVSISTAVTTLYFEVHFNLKFTSLPCMQANVGRQVAQLGVSASPADKALKNCNFYAKVVHVSAAADAPGGIAQRRDRTRVIGKTNTEYATCAPVWNSNRNRAACQHNQPRTQHMVAGSARVEVNAASEGVEVGEEDGPVQGLDLCFYLKQSDLLKGHLCITLYQETYSMRGGVVDTPIGEVNIPLSAVSISPDDGPCHTNVQWYPVGNYTPSSTLSTPAVLVGLCIQDKAMNNASDTTPQNQTPPGHQRNASSGGGSTMDAAVVYYDGDDSDDGDDSEDSDADDGGDKRGERGAGGGGGGGHSPSPSVSPARPALAHAVLSRWKVGDCYEWMRHIGKGGDMIDIQTLAHMYEETEYPLAWCEAHARAVGQQAAMIARVGKLYTQMMQDQRTFRGSQEKKNKDLQFIATNLHAQIWSTLPAPGSTVVHFDMTTTGAPSAHALGFKHGGLVSLEGALSALKRRVMAAWSSTAAGPAAPGGAPSGARTEQEQEAFARLLMEYEMKSLAVSIRRAVVTSQVLSITACNFATKLEMMALGTLLCQVVGDQLALNHEQKVGRMAIPHVLAALRAHAHDKHVVEWGCYAVAQIADLANHIEPISNNEALADAPELVSQALRRHGEYKSCVEAAFHAIARLAQADVAFQRILMGVCGDVPAVMRHLSSGDGCDGVRAYGCMAVQALAQNNLANKQQLGNSGACELVLDAHKAGADGGDDDVRIQACLAIEALATGCKANHCKLSGAIPCLVRNLPKHPHDEDAWLAIGALADDSASNQRALGTAGVCRMALQTANSAESSASAKHRSFEAMVNLAALPSNSKKHAEAKSDKDGHLSAFGIAIKFAREPPTTEDTVEWAVLLIRSLAETESNRAAMGADEDLYALLGRDLRRSRGEELARKWAATGYLISFEGLLSVQGKEHGMVEDTVAAMSILQTYAVHVKASDQPSGLEVTLDTEAHVLTAQVGAKIMARLPEAIRAALSSAAGCYRAPIVPVFFTQGIDIAQSMSNQTSAKTRGSFQADINASSFHKLNQYCTKFYSEADTANPADPRPLVTHMHLLRLEAAVMAQQHNQKNTAVLLESERAVQLLGGGRVTFCKSGKDRTAMSVTLEESFMLLDKHLDGVGGEARALRVANVLRAHGTRIAVAEKNIGSPLYSFNAIQRQFIPELYRAPVQTIQDVLTSFQKRDS